MSAQGLSPNRMLPLGKGMEGGGMEKQESYMERVDVREIHLNRKRDKGSFSSHQQEQGRSRPFAHRSGSHSLSTNRAATSLLQAFCVHQLLSAPCPVRRPHCSPISQRRKPRPRDVGIRICQAHYLQGLSLQPCPMKWVLYQPLVQMGKLRAREGEQSA